MRKFEYYIISKQITNVIPKVYMVRCPAISSTGALNCVASS